MIAAPRAGEALTVRTVIVVVLVWLTLSVLLGLLIGAVVRNRDRKP